MTMATKLESLGIKRLEGIHYYVRDLERSRQFYCGKLDFAETWRCSPDVEKTGKQTSACCSDFTMFTTTYSYCSFLRFKPMRTR